MKQECGLCGDSNFENLMGPYCGGPFVYYCKKCRLIVDDWIDTATYLPKNKAILEKYWAGMKAHKEWFELNSVKEKAKS